MLFCNYLSYRTVPGVHMVAKRLPTCYIGIV